MSNTNTGGPAFPLSTVDPYDRSVTTCDGMTLRDYFAAKAIPELTRVYSFGSADPLDYANLIAEDAYLIADAMLRARGA